MLSSLDGIAGNRQADTGSTVQQLATWWADFGEIAKKETANPVPQGWARISNHFPKGG